MRKAAKATEGQLSEDFLTDKNARAELVGVINRMDRQFIKDPAAADAGATRLRRNRVVYRFAYSLQDNTDRPVFP